MDHWIWIRNWLELILSIEYENTQSGQKSVFTSFVQEGKYLSTVSKKTVFSVSM